MYGIYAIRRRLIKPGFFPPPNFLENRSSNEEEVIVDESWDKENLGRKIDKKKTKERKKEGRRKLFDAPPRLRELGISIIILVD